MPDLVRVSLAIEEPLLKKLETMRKAERYTNRSEFIRDMIRDKLVQQQWERDQDVVGTVTLVYNHHHRQLSEKLTHLQHHHHDMVLATTHVHLNKDMCVEVIVVKGQAGQIQKVAGLLRQQKGVLHSAISLSSAGKGLA